MEYKISKETSREYLKTPKNFDWDLVDQDNGFAKCFEIFPKDVYLQLKSSTNEAELDIYKLIEKSAAMYSFVLAIPKLKVYISNFGIEQFNQDKTKTAPWWDVRDLGLSMLKNADRNLSEAISLAFKVEELKNILPFFKNANPYIATPIEFHTIYSINYSPEVYKMLVPLMERAIHFLLNAKIKPCKISDLIQNENISKWIKQAIVFYALYYASEMPIFTFLNNSVVIQYEELPWQKSVVLEEDRKVRAGQNFLKLADESITAVLNFVKENFIDFPCYATPITPSYFPLKKKSGLYL